VSALISARVSAPPACRLTKSLWARSASVMYRHQTSGQNPHPRCQRRSPRMPNALARRDAFARSAPTDDPEVFP
jgi:hypothetical protein